MKWMIASDLHGSAYYCRKMLEAFEREGADRLFLLGDLLYHGPRNDLPREYAPKEVIPLLNGKKEKLLCVRGNCDAEVDQMVLEFPVLADYAVLPERPLALAVKGSAEDSVPLDYAALPETILIEKETASALRAELTLPEALEAPVEKGQTVGKVSIFQDDTLLNEYEVKAAADAPLLTFGGALELLWQCLLGA